MAIEKYPIFFEKGTVYTIEIPVKSGHLSGKDDQGKDFYWTFVAKTTDSESLLEEPSIKLIDEATKKEKIFTHSRESSQRAFTQTFSGVTFVLMLLDQKIILLRPVPEEQEL